VKRARCRSGRLSVTISWPIRRESCHQSTRADEKNYSSPLKLCDRGVAAANLIEAGADIQGHVDALCLTTIGASRALKANRITLSLAANLEDDPTERAVLPNRIERSNKVVQSVSDVRFGFKVAGGNVGK
jgi:hypothetical protein